MRKTIEFTLSVILILTSCTPQSNNSFSKVRISDIQGCGHVSAFVGQRVNGVEGIVTHKFSNGFTMQSIIDDSMDCSSEAVFVMTGEYPNVKPGQQVIVDAVVNEYSAGVENDHNLSRTELIDPKIKVINENGQYPVPITLGKIGTVPMNFIKQSNEFDIYKNGLDYYESLEFMVVEIERGIVVGPKNSYNEFFVLPETFISANAISDIGALNKSLLDENPEKIMIDAASSFSQAVNVGDRFTQPIVGIMDYTFGNYRIWTISNPIIESQTIVTNSSMSFEKTALTVATYNIENFSRFDDQSKIRQIGCQIAKELQSPDIVLLNELLDDSGTKDDGVVTAEKNLETLIQAITDCGGPNYAYSDNPPKNNADGGIPGGNIRSCVIFLEETELSLEKPLSEIGEITFDNGKFEIEKNPYRLFKTNDYFNGTRKPTVWLFSWEGEQFLIMGVHLISHSANSPDWGNLQPPEKPEQFKREQQTVLINDYVQYLEKYNSELNIILAGDFNDYPWSDTLETLIENTSLYFPNPQNTTDKFSYIYEGNAFQFDYIIVNKNLNKRISHYSILHLNTLVDNKAKVSDHDPVLIEVSK